MTEPVHDFIPCDFNCKRLTSKALVRWTRLDEVKVSIQLPGRGAQSSARRGRAWDGVHPEAARAQKYLATLSEFNIGQVHEYTLNLKPRGKKTIALKWSADLETDDLREARVMLEQVGHVAFAEALAYRDQALAVGSHRLFEPGIALLRTGIRTLGNAYASEGLVDDSDTHLVLASHHLAKMDLETAWTDYRNVLDSRLGAYQRLFGVDE